MNKYDGNQPTGPIARFRFASSACRGGFAGAVLGVAAALALGGCNTAASNPSEASASPTDTITILEGDVLKISFPSARGLDTTQEVRRDGKIALAVVGEVSAVGLTPTKLAEELANLYAGELVSKDVNVAVVSSTFEVTVSGAVARPGKIVSKRPLTAFEAVMEAGGFDNTKADLKSVVVVRREGGKENNFKLDLGLVLRGKSTAPFYLKPFDVIYVPAKVVWF